MRLAVPLLLALLAACPSSSPPDHPKPTAIDDTAVRIRIAQAEARRNDGIAELTEIVASGSAGEKALALRGLGRIGGPRALRVLLAALDKDPAIAGAAATAIGLATSLDDDDTTLRAELTARLTQIYPLAIGHEAELLEAMGRAGIGEPVQQLVTSQLANRPAAISAAAALALGRFGRRKIPLTTGSRESLVEATRHADATVRYAAAYALARESFPPSKDPAPKEPDDRLTVAANTRLAELLDDGDPDVRAIAAQALARRKAVVTHASALAPRLYDVDWRVAVEAVRALGGDGSDDAGRARVAVALARWQLGIDSGRRVAILTPGPQGAAVDDPALELLKTGVDPARAGDDMSPSRPERGLLTSIVEAARVAETLPRRQVVVTEADSHVVIEGLRVLQGAAKHDVVRYAVGLIAVLASSPSSKLPATTRGWTECLARSALIRAATVPSYMGINPDRCRLPSHLELQLVGELVSAKVGTVGQRREALRQLLAHGDPRVRVAGMTALPTMWADGNDADHRAAAATVIAALGVTDGLIAGTAVDAATAIYEAAGKPGGDWKDALDAAVVARASSEKDAELAASLFELIGKQKIASGAPACKSGLAGAPVLAKAAASCLAALGQPVDVPAIGRANPPPVDVTTVIGKRVLWHLQTTRGEIVLELRPDIAPWAVATIAMLTGKGFYDGLELHRVVPNFVAQGGDPTQSGWGGPGFTLPAEPSSSAGYVAGGVGMADAGRDSAGSQWFIMHSAAPHLDGRYTWVGSVRSGQNSADALQIGDRVLRATVEITNRP